MPLSASARVSGSSAAMWRYVKSTSPSRRREYSGSIGSLTLSRGRPGPSVVHRDDPRAGALVLLVGERAPLAGGRLDEHLVTALDQLASAAGVSATRYSSVLISLGTPIRKARRHYLPAPRDEGAREALATRDATCRAV